MMKWQAATLLLTSVIAACAVAEPANLVPVEAVEEETGSSVGAAGSKGDARGSYQNDHNSHSRAAAMSMPYALPRSKGYVPLAMAPGYKGYLPLAMAHGYNGYLPLAMAHGYKGYAPLMSEVASKGYIPLQAAYYPPSVAEAKVECAKEVRPYYYHPLTRTYGHYRSTYYGRMMYETEIQKCLERKSAEDVEEGGAEGGPEEGGEGEGEEETVEPVVYPYHTSTPLKCYLPANNGLCRGAYKRYYFNKHSGKCEEFTYGGCHGNSNNFETLEKCQSECSCGLPVVQGGCYAYIPRYYYNSETQRCEKFIYGGCGGNSNNFKTERECVGQCACRLAPTKGLCKGYFVKYYKSQVSGRCERFVYGGCGGNSNKFETKAACELTC